jgi:probable AcnD-accessory protein PrpF
MAQDRIPAVYMRGGTSKGVFFRADVMPKDPEACERLLLRVMGSPDPYGKQTDGMGGATSSTSKIVIVSRSSRPDCDVEYLFGQVAIDAPVVDWSGNCGNLTTAVGPFAIAEGLVDAVPQDGFATMRLWQANIGKRIIARVPMHGGAVVEEGTFELDGVTFPAAEVQLEFLDPGGSAGTHALPTGRPVDDLAIAGMPTVPATLITAGNPTVIVDAAVLGLSGVELQGDVNGDSALLARCEAIRARGAVMMGLAANDQEATEKRPATPKLAMVAPVQPYQSSSGKPISNSDIDLCARMLSMGKLHHAIPGTGSVALAAAAALPGTLVHRVLGDKQRPGATVRMGHPSGVMPVGAKASERDGRWTIDSVTMSRSARRLMEGWVRVPRDIRAASV